MSSLSPPAPADARESTAIFAPDGLLARCLPAFDDRPGQRAMAAAVEETLAGDFLAVEAGTGIGKTLAYLIPAVLSKQKIVVSTATINLQEQILNKEIPFIKRHIDPELTAICVKGRQNYLCLQRWKQVLAAGSLGGSPAEAGPERLEALSDWLSATGTGDRAELPWLPDNSRLWQEICSATEKCLGAKCPDEASCFVNKLRRRAAAARILIVNHHLFFSDLALRRTGYAEVLPRYESVIFDEAHHLENVATQYFGTLASLYQFPDLARDIEKTATVELDPEGRSELIQLARALAAQADEVALLFPRERGRFPLITFMEETAAWPASLAALQDRIAGLARRLAALAVDAEVWQSLGNRLADLAGALTMITAGTDRAFVYWLERRERTVQLGASPIELAEDLRDSLYGNVRSVIFTSATLTARGSFRYFQDRLGLPPDMKTLVLPSPFDYAGRTLLFIPEPGFPEPSHFLEPLVERLTELLTISEGRALLLFTSTRVMSHVHSRLAAGLGLPVLCQGLAPKKVLLEAFRKETQSVLLAVASFWEGVDVPGEALRCVVIDKLPFEVPSDPVVMARIERIREEGGNPFFDFQVPRAIFTLRQGVGRLMRAPDDWGVLAIMDSRLTTKGYGRLFLESLPPSPVTREIEEVRRFFADMEGNFSITDGPPLISPFEKGD